MRFSNLMSFEPSEVTETAKMTEVGYQRYKKKHISRLLTMNEVLKIRDQSLKHGGQIPKLKSSLTNKIIDKLHGLALARLILHCHPSNQDYNLDDLRITYVTSSLGVIDIRLLFDIAYSFIPFFPYESRHLSVELMTKLKDIFYVVYPTEEYVENSSLGPENANCIFLANSKYKSIKFKKQVFSKFEIHPDNPSNGVVPHLKACIICNNKSGEITDDTILYLGSHNMTKAAWGRYAPDGQKLYISNYEMGVIFTPGPGTQASKQRIVRNMGFVYPSSRYSQSDKPFTRGA